MSAPEIIYPPAVGGGTPVGGSGTPDTIPRWTGPSTLGDSIVKQTGSNLGVNLGANPAISRLQLLVPNSGGVPTSADWMATFSADALYRSGFGFQFAAGVAANNRLVCFVSNGTTTGQTAAWTADGSGNVGIGTASPGARLHSVAADGTYQFAVSGTTRAVRFLTNATGANIEGVDPTLSASYQPIIIGGSTVTLANSGSPALTVNTSGNVGIGTASPAQTLDIRNTAPYQLRVGSSPGFSYDIGRSTTDGLLYFYGNQTGANGVVFGGINGERARIDSAGRLLVGTSTAPNSANVRSVLASSVSVYAGIQNTGANVGCAFGPGASAFELYTSSGAYGAEAYTQRMAVSSAGTAAQSQVAIGTSSFTTGRALTTVADLDVFGVRVGRGGGDVATNTMLASGASLPTLSGGNNVVIGVNAMNGATTAGSCIAIGTNATSGNESDRIGLGTSAASGAQAGTIAIGGFAAFLGGATAVGIGANAMVLRGADNIAIGWNAMGSNPGSAQTTCVRNVGIGREALNAAVNGSEDNTAVGHRAGVAITTGDDNVLLGATAGDSITTGNSNIVIGSGADLAAATDSNQLVLGDATNYVATNGGATTYYATAGASLGYMRVRLNGTYVKIEVFADV